MIGRGMIIQSQRIGLRTSHPEWNASYTTRLCTIIGLWVNLTYYLNTYVVSHYGTNVVYQ
jgi:hypothetical protein